MGWWQIKDSTGQIDRGPDTGLRVGDDPADIFQKAVEQITKLYQEVFGRKPARVELHAALEFVIYRDFEDPSDQK